MSLISVLPIFLIICSNAICVWIYYVLRNFEQRNKLRLVILFGMIASLLVTLLAILSAALIPFERSALSRFIGTIIGQRPGLGFWIAVMYLTNLPAAWLAVRKSKLRFQGIVVFILLAIFTLFILGFMFLFIILSGLK